MLVMCVCACACTYRLLRTCSHSVNGTAGTDPQSIRPRYGSCSATTGSSVPRTGGPPCGALPWPPTPKHTSRPPSGPPRGERPPQLAALTLIDLAPVLTQTPGETFLFFSRGGRHRLARPRGVMVSGEGSVFGCGGGGRGGDSTNYQLFDVFTVSVAPRLLLLLLLLLFLSSALFFFFFKSPPHPLEMPPSSTPPRYHYTVCFSPRRLWVVNVIDGGSAQSRGKAEQVGAHGFNPASPIRTEVEGEPLPPEIVGTATRKWLLRAFGPVMSRQILPPSIEVVKVMIICFRF